MTEVLSGFTGIHPTISPKFLKAYLQVLPHILCEIEYDSVSLLLLSQILSLALKRVKVFYLLFLHDTETDYPTCITKGDHTVTHGPYIRVTGLTGLRK